MEIIVMEREKLVLLYSKPFYRELVWNDRKKQFNSLTNLKSNLGIKQSPVKTQNRLPLLEIKKQSGTSRCFLKYSNRRRYQITRVCPYLFFLIYFFCLVPTFKLNF